MRLTYGARAPSLWQDNPAGTNGACPGAAALMTLLDFFQNTCGDLHMLDMFGNISPLGLWHDKLCGHLVILSTPVCF